MWRSVAILSVAVVLLVSLDASAKGKSRPAPPELGPQTAEKLLDLHNAQRSKEGAPPLRIDPKLTAAAQAYAEFLARTGKFSHNADGGPGSRIKENGYKGGAYGENIARGQRSPDSVVDGWMHSEGHRKNILNKSYHDVGFGYAVGAKGQIVWVTDFGGGSGGGKKHKNKK